VVSSSVVIVILTVGVSSQAPARAPAWTTVTAREGDFRIDFPSRPQEQARVTPSAGGSIERKTYSGVVGGCVLQLERTHYPRPFAVEQLADRLAELKKRQLGRRSTVRENPVTVDEVTGEQFEYQVPSPRANGPMTVLTRHFIKGSSYYAMTVVSAPGRPLPPEADRFLDSFHFNATPPAGAVGARTAVAMAKANPAPKAGTAPKGRPAAAPRAPAGAPRVTVKGDTPEDAIRTFMVAAVAHDDAALREITVPGTDVSLFLQGRPPAPEAVKQVQSALAKAKIRRLRPGEQIRLPQGETYVVHPAEVTADRMLLFAEGSKGPAQVRKIDGRWKVYLGPTGDELKAMQKAFGR
jgi:hypothetical protein